MVKKIQNDTVRRIKARRAQGATYQELAEKFGVSVGSVSNALKVKTKRSAAKARSARNAPAERAEDMPPPTFDEIRAWLAEQIRALKADLDSTHDDAPRRASLNRQLVTTQILLTKIMPPEPEPEKENVDMVAAAERARRLLHELIDRSSEGPACRTCGRPLPGDGTPP